MEHPPRLERTALVVDDDVFVVSALAELLDDDGFDVLTATNGFSALRHAIAARPTVILLDVALPERSGTELVTDLRADPATRDVAIVLVTGFADQLSEAQVADVDGVVAKPFDAGDLLATIQHAIQSAASRRAEVAPVAAVSHRAAGMRARRAAASRRTRGRR
ncbi:MAG: response regulator [Chloroflexi bacterium]|nr:response regulator [Chloroflexota bacterium]MBV9603204.1 response regulator [Chloroflexota bacterium]